MNYEGWPEPGDLVVGKVDEIEDFGVFVDLEAYAEKRGLVHVSEVASGWIKNISDHVSEGQTVVAKVLDVDRDAQQIDLSLKDVNDHQRSDAIQAWKNEQKADNWLELAFPDADDATFRRVAEALLEEFPSLYDAFEEAAIHGEEALEDVDLDADDVDAVVETARENVSVPYVNVSGYVTLECPTADGVDVIKDALDAAEGEDGEVPDEVDLDVTYVGSPEYRITVQAPSYKTAETALEASADRATAVVGSAGGAGEYHRERRSEE